MLRHFLSLAVCLAMITPLTTESAELARQCPDGTTSAISFASFGQETETYFKVDENGDRLGYTEGLEGSYKRDPYENFYHGGTLTMEGNDYRWTNDGGTTWRMGLDSNAWTLTDLDGPYAGEIRPLAWRSDVCGAFLSDALAQANAHISGDSVLSDVDLQGLVEGIRAEVDALDDDDWPQFRDAVFAYVAAFEARYGALFSSPDLVDPDDFSPEGQLQFLLKQLLFDLAYQGNFAEEDLTVFAESAYFPGPVSATATRLLAATVEVDGNYATDPGVFLNQQETVIRPTGHYAPPGELVTVSVPPEAVGKDIKVRVGFYRGDMEAGFWPVFNRFPRISSLYDIDQETITVANPFGGGIYFEVPDGSALGNVSITLDGAVKMPMYSSLDLIGHSSDVDAFRAEVDAWDVPEFEIHSPHFSATLPMNEGQLYTDPAALLELMNRGFEDIRLMAGRPLPGIRPEWLAYDRAITVYGTAMTASYPIYSNEGNRGTVGEYLAAPQNWSSPVRLMNPDFFDVSVDTASTRGRDWYIYVLFHEWGHLHNLPTLQFQEQESNVHLLASVFYNKTMGADIDTALQYSGFQFFDRDQAALDTMFSPNWQLGERLSEGEQIYGIWDNEVRYQTRSWARIVEIAGLYGWEAVGDIHRAFYERGLGQSEPVNYGLDDDDFIETASVALGMNLGPIFDFWGVPPSSGLAERLAEYPLPQKFRARLEHYRSIAPRTDEDFEAVYQTHAKLHRPESEVMIRMDWYREHFDAEMSNTIIARIDRILADFPETREGAGGHLQNLLDTINTVRGLSGG